MEKNLFRVFTLILLMLIAAPIRAKADDVPDPCKLLSETDVRNTLGFDGPVSIDPTALAPSIAQVRVVDRGAGNIGFAIPTASGPRKNTLVCRGRAGSIKLFIGVTALSQTKVDKEEERTELDLLHRKSAFKVETATYGSASCQEIIKPASDMLGRDPQLKNLVVSRIRCYTSRNGWQVGIVATAWTPQSNPPFALDKLSNLVELAAQHVPPVPPTAEQNVTTTNAGVPAGFMAGP